MATQREVTRAAVCDPEWKAEIAQRALEGFRKHGTLAAASRFAKIDRRTLKGWIKDDPLLKMAFADADESVTDELEESAIEQAKSGKSPTVMVHLLASRRERYAHKTTTIVESPSTSGVIDQLRQIALAQPILRPTIEAALSQALESIRSLEHKP